MTIYNYKKGTGVMFFCLLQTICAYLYVSISVSVSIGRTGDPKTISPTSNNLILNPHPSNPSKNRSRLVIGSRRIIVLQMGQVPFSPLLRL